MQRILRTLSVVLVGALTVFAASTAHAVEDPPDFQRYLTVRFAPGTTPAERTAARQAVGASIERSLAGPLLQQISLPPADSTAAAAAELERRQAVIYASPSGTWQADAHDFNDPFLPNQWALSNTGQVFMSQFRNGQQLSISGTPGADISALAALDLLDPPDAGERVRLGVIDSGAAYEHLDLADNMLVVPGSDPYDGDDDPRDLFGHGTHVASIAAGVAGNGIGTVGVNPWAEVLPLRAGGEDGRFSWAAIQQAVSVGLANGVKVFNGSFSGAEPDPGLETLMAANQDVLFVFSAGNGGTDYIGDDHDVAGGAGHRYPCDTRLENVICVAASDWNDELASFSDFGVSSVDLAAPGASVYAARPCITPATGPDDESECPWSPDDPLAPVGLGGGPFAFQLQTGTSMAAPAVAAAATLLWQKCPDLRSSQVKRAIVESVTKLPALDPKLAWGGRLNVAAALESVSDCPAASAQLNWPTPPLRPGGPASDAGAGNGGVPAPSPIVPALHPGQSLYLEPSRPAPAQPRLSFRVIKPSSARVGRSKFVRFKLRCSAICSGALSFKPVSRKQRFKTAKTKIKRARAGTRTIRVTIPRATLKKVRKLLKRRRAVRLKFTLVVADQAGRKSRKTAFNVRLRR